MSIYVLIYYVCDDYVQRRQPYREDHLSLARAARDRGELVLGGALGEPPDRALLVFRGLDRNIAENFAQNDPYVLNGLIQRWEVQPWQVVIGDEQMGLSR